MSDKIKCKVSRHPSERYPKKVIINDTKSYIIADMWECVETIVHEYHSDALCMREVLADVMVEGFTLEETTQIFGTCLNRIEGDILIRVNTTDGISEDLFYYQ